VTLRFSSAVQLKQQQAGLIYALLSEANGRARKISPALPDGVIPEPIEQCRPCIAPQSKWNFALTIIAADGPTADEQVRSLRDGLESLRRSAPRAGVMVGGNFHVDQVRDLVTQRVLPNRVFSLHAIPVQHLQDELGRILHLSQLTLRFTTPLRMSHSKHGLAAKRDPQTGKVSKPDFMDRHRFDVDVFLRRVVHRIERVGLAELNIVDTPAAHGVASLVENHLVWFDVAYSAKEREKHLPGVLGDIVISGLTPRQVAQLVVAQYLHVGENTSFGHGRFRIAQLGPDPFAWKRAVSLRELAFEPRHLDQAAAKFDLPPGTAGQLLQSIRAGSYQPQPCTRLTISTGDRSRTLSIPHREDRALQRAVHAFLAPVLDHVLEASSLAYRRGRHREQAARAVNRAAAEGFAWGLKADFADFFDTVDHEQLKRRLRAYLADPALEGLIMMWVRNGSPEPARGLPTGAVLSPLLANLFLDEFDEAIAAGGGRLLRYADDFVILFRDRTQADALLNLARQAAADLKLQLNEHKTRLVDLTEPFRFLGFEFSCTEHWSESPLGDVQPIHQIGWKNVADLPPPPVGIAPLPGETDELLTTPRSLVLLGPDGDWLDLRHGMLSRKSRGEDQSQPLVPIERVDHLFVVGFPSLNRHLLRHLAQSDTPLLLASDNGLDEVWITSRAIEDPLVVRSQFRCHEDPTWRLDIARALVAAKLDNYAMLAAARPVPDSTQLGHQIRTLAESARLAERIEQLLGYEGAAANAWYSALAQSQVGRFQFPGRRAPRAKDPLNILLNIGFTALHNWTAHFLRVHGFAPAVGIMHEHRPGHAALASDLMEPFRHLVDAVVLDCSRALSIGDFRFEQEGPFSTTIKFPALKQFRAALWKRLLTFHLPPKRQHAIPYLKSLERQIITLRRHLLDRQAPFVPFRQIPSPVPHDATPNQEPPP
jgi:CRISPR-associated endonuclease Cas1